MFKSIKPNLATGIQTVTVVNATIESLVDDMYAISISLSNGKRQTLFSVKDLYYKDKDGKQALASFGTELIRDLMDVHEDLIGLDESEFSQALIGKELFVDVYKNKKGYLQFDIAVAEDDAEEIEL